MYHVSQGREGTLIFVDFFPLLASGPSVLRRRNVSASSFLCWSIKEQQGSQQDLLAQQAQAVQIVRQIAPEPALPYTMVFQAV